MRLLLHHTAVCSACQLPGPAAWLGGVVFVCEVRFAVGPSWMYNRRSSLSFCFHLAAIQFQRFCTRRRNLLKKLWSQWKIIAAKLGNFWGRILLTVFYFLIATPFALAVRFLSDPLQLKRGHQTSFWHPKTLPEPTLEEARRQF